MYITLTYGLWAEGCQCSPKTNALRCDLRRAMKGRRDQACDLTLKLFLARDVLELGIEQVHQLFDPDEPLPMVVKIPRDDDDWQPARLLHERVRSVLG